MRKFSFTQKDVKNRLLNCRRGKRAITNEGKILRKKGDTSTRKIIGVDFQRGEEKE